MKKKSLESLVGNDGVKRSNVSYIKRTAPLAIRSRYSAQIECRRDGLFACARTSHKRLKDERRSRKCVLRIHGSFLGCVEVQFKYFNAFRIL